MCSKLMCLYSKSIKQIPGMQKRSAHPELHQSELPFPTPSLASVSIASLIAVLAWLAFATQTDITISRMMFLGLSVIEGIERLSSDPAPKQLTQAGAKHL
jgi:hypothetical protein